MLGYIGIDTKEYFVVPLIDKVYHFMQYDICDIRFETEAAITDISKHSILWQPAFCDQL